MARQHRSVALVTGACGGMGQACARLLGRHHDLALSDIDGHRVDELAEALTREGHVVVARHAGDFRSRGAAAGAVAAALAAGPFGALVHTAGLSPALAGWEDILLTNAAATEELLRAVEQDAQGQFNAVLIASVAGHSAIAMPHAQLDALLDDPLADGLLQDAGPLFRPLADPARPFAPAMLAYAHSKSAVIRLVERRAAAWAGAGRRINSISPGPVRTPMGLTEIARNPDAAALAERTPLGLVTPVDIANAAEFLLSPLADAITGTDLRIDGGAMTALRSAGD